METDGENVRTLFINMAERGLPEVRKRFVKPLYRKLFVRCCRHKIVEIKIKVQILVRITCEELRLLAHTVRYNGILWVSGKRGGSTTHSDKVRCLQTVPLVPTFLDGAGTSAEHFGVEGMILFLEY